VVSERDDTERDEFFEGEEELLGGEPPPVDPYTPDTGPGPGEERAYNVLKLAWIVIGIIVAAIVIYALMN
jgi:hypothetical protein